MKEIKELYEFKGQPGSPELESEWAKTWDTLRDTEGLDDSTNDKNLWRAIINQTFEDAKLFNKHAQNEVSDFGYVCEETSLELRALIRSVHSQWFSFICDTVGADYNNAKTTILACITIDLDNVKIGDLV
jgi:hypothetical protein